jgi:predicted Fe-Mo cluster-binding NifX family protein
MKVAIPTENGVVYPHFGHCPTFTIFDVHPDTREYRELQTLTPPPHERGVIPAWLSQIGCTHIIAGGMGQRAVALFEQNGVHVVSGAPSIRAADVVAAFLNGELVTDANPCTDPDFRRVRHGHGGEQCESKQHDESCG